jgi:L,D-peptidoglycan transpeptidase YkuD (ErfK/YbiS/YcfS/YnhG family)
MSCELPSVIGALDILAIKLAATKWHATVGAGVTQSKGTAFAIAAYYERNLQQHRFMKLVAVRAVGRQGAIPKAREHERIGRLALGKVEFRHESRNCQ